MKKDTVLLAVEEYNELRDLKKEIEEGKTLVIISGWNCYKRNFITTEKALEEIAEANKLLQKENEDLRNVNKLKETTLNDLKKMSYLQFCKWRKS